MKIAVDFDGTIVEHAYPEIGKELLFAFETLKQLQKQGHQLILWTVRTGEKLNEAVEFCKKNGIEFYAVNKNYPEEKLDDETSRKINALFLLTTAILEVFRGGVKYGRCSIQIQLFHKKKNSKE